MIRANRPLILIFVVMIFLMSFSFYSFKRMSASLDDIYVHQVSELQTTMELRRSYRDISFRMAAYTSGILPAAGNYNKLEEVKQKLDVLWPSYFEALSFEKMPEDSHELVENLKKSILKTNEEFLTHLSQAYQVDNKKLILKLLQEDWPEVQASLMAPLDKLSNYHAVAVNTEFNQMIQFEKIISMVGVFAFSIGTLFLLITAKKMQHLSHQYEEQVKKNVAASKLASLGEMAGGIAHEINNPLAVIHMRTDLIKENIESGQMDKTFIYDSILIVQKTTSRIAKIIKGLRSFARDGKDDPFQLISAQEIIEETLDFCKEKFKNNNIKMIVNMPTNKVMLDCRAIQISQVILNLLGNAFDAILNTKDPWIKLDVIEQAESIEIHVVDSGSGIPKHIQEKIMQPFFTTKEIGKGTGLGLSISKGIIESHHGKLFINSESKNTEFVIQLPKPNTNIEAKSA